MYVSYMSQLLSGIVMYGYLVIVRTRQMFVLGPRRLVSYTWTSKVRLFRLDTVILSITYKKVVSKHYYYLQTFHYNYIKNNALIWRM